MTQPNRRSFLGSVGAGLLAGSALRASPTARPQRANAGDLDGLATMVRETPRGELLDAAVKLHRDGTDWRDLLAAAFLAGIRDVEPRPVGFQFHCVMMTNSAFEIAARAPANERLAAALYNLDDFKQSQARDARGKDWQLGAAPPTAATDAAAATRRLSDVLANWDLDGADAAATAAAHCATLDDAFEALWWFSMRDFTNIGHNPIFTTQAHRTLQQIGWRHGTDVMRSLVHGLLDGKPGDGDATFVANRERAAQLVIGTAPTAANGSDPDLLATLRTASADAAATAVATGLADGLSFEALWNTLRLFAAEQAWRDPGILSAHAMTSIHALRYIAGRARSPATRAMAVLQATSWQVLYRDFLSARGTYDHDVAGIETLQPADQVMAATGVFEAAAAGARAAAPLALAASRDGTAALATASRHWLLRKAREHHDYKFTAALLEEMRAADADTAGRMFAASLGYLRKPSDRDHALWAKLDG